jgi:hypothetical protein
MAGLDPAIHLLRKTLVKVDTQVKPAYDDLVVVAYRASEP